MTRHASSLCRNAWTRDNTRKRGYVHVIVSMYINTPTFVGSPQSLLLDAEESQIVTRALWGTWRGALSAICDIPRPA